MKYFFPILLLVLTSCNTNQDYKDLTTKFPEIEDTNMNIQYCDEKTKLQAGDTIMVYGGTNSFLKEHFGCDTCSAKVESIFFSKPTGSIAFLEFSENKSKSIVFSISLYYWGNERGYNVSNLDLWKRKMTDKELDILQADFITRVDRHRIDRNVYFKIKN